MQSATNYKIGRTNKRKYNNGKNIIFKSRVFFFVVAANLQQSHGCFEKKRTPATLKISSVTDLNRRTNFSQTKKPYLNGLRLLVLTH
jgi:hypothetical protein